MLQGGKPDPVEAIYSDLAMPEDMASQDLLNITSYAEP